MHGAGNKARPGGRPVVHGLYSKFLTVDEADDFAAFKTHFDLTEDLAFAATKVYHAAGKVKPEQLPGLLETPSKIALRRKQIVEGTVLKVEVDMLFLRGFLAKVLEFVTQPQAQAELLAYVNEHLGSAFQE
jgi:hypothetical protein